MVLPIFFLLIFGIVEFSRLSIICHAADNAAYKAARVGIIPGATNSEVSAAAQASLQSTGLIPSQIIVTPFPLDDSSDNVTVEVTIDVLENSWVKPIFTGHLTINGTSTLGTERYRGFTP
jgi:Flp pilus assembly protein TadG